ncbi:hypothetical protein ACP70R_027019 [Stipagrostis hirtigluma subsp. patula]
MSLVLTSALCERETQVQMVDKDQYDSLKQQLRLEMHKYLILSCSYSSKVWLVGDGVKDEEQRKAQEGVHLVPYSQFPPRMIRDSCVYHSTPALVVPDSLENLHGCEVRLAAAAGDERVARGGRRARAGEVGRARVRPAARRGAPRWRTASAPTTAATLLLLLSDNGAAGNGS